MTNLGTIGGATGDSHGLAINDNKAVAGDSITSGGAVHAFREKTTDSSPFDLGVISGTGNSYGTGINTANDVSGKSNYSGGSAAVFHTFWYQDSTSTMHDLPRTTGGPPPAIYPSYANAIDNSSPPILVGAADGYTDSPCGSTTFKHVYRWTGTSSEAEIGTLSGGEEAHAFAINAGGVVAGDSSIHDDQPCGPMPTPHAFVAVPSSGTYTFTQLDGTVSAVKQSRAFGINGNATSYSVVGQYQGSTDSSGAMRDSFLYSYSNGSGSWSDLIGLLPSGSHWSEPFLAYGINSSGDIVGQGTYTDPATQSVYTHAFLIQPSGTGPSGGSNGPSVGDPNAAQALAFNALLLSGAQAQAPLGATGLAFSAPLRHGQEVAAATSGPPAAATNAVPLLPAPSVADPLFAAPEMQWTGELAGWDNGLAAGPLG
jgi:hypothetical protein